ncbi:MAG: CoA-binding protein [Bacteroidota bacterium]
MSKKTLVIGASTKPQRYSNIATHRLLGSGHEVVLVGYREGQIGEHPIHKGTPHFDDVDTITLYLNPTRQQPFYDYFLSLKPKRIIFNPGTENPELIKLARENGIEPEVACTLVLLASNQY